MIEHLFYIIAVSCTDTTITCEAFKFPDMPTFATYAECQTYKARVDAQFEVTDGVFVCVTDPVENSAGGYEEEELTAMATSERPSLGS